MMRARRRRERARASRGFTIIEVIVAMGIMVVGLMAIVAMQQQTILVNSIARQRSVANQIAQTWLERLKQDGRMRWNQAPDLPSGRTPDMVIANTTWLSAVTVAANQFQTPLISPLHDASNAYDFRGNELPPIAGGVVPPGVTPWFCVSFRPQWVYPGRALRVDVRVFWPRPQSGALVVDCVDPAPAGPLPAQFMATYLSTVISYAEVI